MEACITALAPAVFEEVLFRGVFIYNLRARGFVDLACLFISALLFSAIHLTNLAGQDLTSVALQVGYSLVIGMVFAAIYLKNGSILQVMAAHFLVDHQSHLCPAGVHGIHPAAGDLCPAAGGGGGLCRVADQLAAGAGRKGCIPLCHYSFTCAQHYRATVTQAQG